MSAGGGAGSPRDELSDFHPKGSYFPTSAHQSPGQTRRTQRRIQACPKTDCGRQYQRENRPVPFDDRKLSRNFGCVKWQGELTQRSGWFGSKELRRRRELARQDVAGK